MAFAIWGVGNRGKVIYEYIKEYVSVFIDNNSKLVGQQYDEIPIVSYETFKNKYLDDVIIVSPYDNGEIVSTLQKDNISCYLLSNDCPSEYVEQYNQELLGILLKETSADKLHIICGYTLFGILLYKEVLKYSSNIYLYDSEPVDYDIVEKINAILKININCLFTLDERSFSHCNVFNASKKIDCRSISAFSKAKIIESFYVYEKLRKYSNEDVKKFKDIHLGERCFIVATGPSVRLDDLEKLKSNNEICISMNKIFYCYDETDWRADYYVGEDINLLNYYRKELIESIKVPAFISDLPKEENKWPDNFNIVHLSVNQKESRYYGCSDFSKGYVCGLSVIFGCINLAVYMGFKEIYIIGADLNYLSDMKSSQNHFYGDKDILKANLPFNFSEVLRSYKGINEYCKSKGVHLYNATRGGRLEILERVDLDLVLSK